MSPSNIDELILAKRQEGCQELKQLVESVLDVGKWGFRHTYSRITAKYPPSIIYDSQWCRIMFSSGGGDIFTGSGLAVYYGRLHASNDSFEMFWNNEECGCWHQVDVVLGFLDGFSPKEAVDQLENQQKPKIIGQFKETELGKELWNNRFSEFQIRLQRLIWEQYGQRFFQIFDIRHPDIWERFVGFVRGYYSIRGYSPYPGERGNDQLC